MFVVLLFISGVSSFADYGMPYPIVTWENQMVQISVEPPPARKVEATIQIQMPVVEKDTVIRLTPSTTTSAPRRASSRAPTAATVTTAVPQLAYPAYPSPTPAVSPPAVEYAEDPAPVPEPGTKSDDSRFEQHLAGRLLFHVFVVPVIFCRLRII